MSAVARTTFLPILVFLRLFVVELFWQACVRRTTCPYYLDLDVTAHVGDAGLRTPSLYQVRSSSASPFGRYGAFSVSTSIGLVALTFERLNGVKAHPSRGFLPTDFHLALTLPFSGTGQTDRRTN